MLPPRGPSSGLLGDFGRPVILIASMALGFFPVSLPLAGVPVGSWPAFTVAAGVGGSILAGSFLVTTRRTRFLLALAIVDSLTVGALGWLYRDYYHQVGLLYAVVVAALAVVHGLRPALVATLIGAFLVPFVIQQQPGANPTDLVYAGIYLWGSALLPWAGARLAEQRATAIRRQLRLTQKGEREAVLILGRAAEAKDGTTAEHVGRVGELSARLALAVGVDAKTGEALKYAAMLHDVGKLHVPDHILKKRGRLTDEEQRVMREHTVWGPRILGDSSAFELARILARSHHENWDGSGYPDGLRGEEIPFSARVVRLADVFDALVSERPYKPAWPIDRCIEELQRGADRLFDPELLRMFIQLPLAELYGRMPEPLPVRRPLPIALLLQPPAADLGSSQGPYADLTVLQSQGAAEVPDLR